MKSSNVNNYISKKNIYTPIKRVLDILFSLFGLVGTGILSLCIVLTNLILKDTGPVFYCQKRIGLNGKPFTMYKFRTMLTGAEEMLDQLLKCNTYRAEWNDKQKLDNDPRITKFGRFLRKTSLDEFPQFLNVLKGDMSIIGPRPLVEGELEAHGGDRRYFSVKPGLTGWWACNGRSDVEYYERLELEYYYIENFSFALDIKCFFKTIYSLLCKTGSR